MPQSSPTTPAELRALGNRYRFFDLIAEPDEGDDFYAPTMREARRLLEAAAEAGDADAMLDLGDFLFSELGLASKPQTAEMWYRRAVETTGRADARNRLGVLLDRSRRYAEARKCYAQAAAEGLRLAQFNLAMLYRRGQGVERSDAEAMHWLRQAASEGDGIALWHMAEICADATSPLHDADEAARLYARALEAGIHEAAFPLGRLHFEAGRYAEALPLLRRALVWGGSLSRQAQQLIDQIPA